MNNRKIKEIWLSTAIFKRREPMTWFSPLFLNESEFRSLLENDKDLKK